MSKPLYVKIKERCKTIFLFSEFKLKSLFLKLKEQYHSQLQRDLLKLFKHFRIKISVCLKIFRISERKNKKIKNKIKN